MNLDADLVVVHGYGKLPVDDRKSFSRAVNKVATALGCTTIDLSWDTILANVDRADLTPNEHRLVTVSGPRLADDLNLLTTLTDQTLVAQYV